MSDGKNPSSGPNNVTTSRRVLVITLVLIWEFELKSLANGTLGGVELVGGKRHVK